MRTHAQILFYHNNTIYNTDQNFERIEFKLFIVPVKLCESSIMTVFNFIAKSKSIWKLLQFKRLKGSFASLVLIYGPNLEIHSLYFIHATFYFSLTTLITLEIYIGIYSW